MKKISIKNLTAKIGSALCRFYLALTFVFGTAVYLLLRINFPEQKFEDTTLIFLILSALISVPIALWLEGRIKMVERVLFTFLPIGILAYYCYSLIDFDLPADQYQVIVLGFIFALISFVVPFLKKENDIPFWNFTKATISQAFVSLLFSGILFLGLGLAIYSLEVLFKIDISDKIYANLSVFCYVIFTPLYFLSNLPEKKEMHQQEISFDRFFKVLGLYIFLPVLAIYTLILYVYFLQILVKWELPNGWVSTLVSILGLGGFLCMIILYPLRLKNENKTVKLLSNYFPILLMPLLILMSVGIFRRLGDYGLTINRGYVLILNLWFYAISIYLFITKAKQLKWIVISFATIAFLASAGPWSVFSVTKKMMVKEIGQMLNDTKLLKNGKVIDNSASTIMIDSITSQKLSEAIKYTLMNYGHTSLQQYFGYSIQKLDAWEITEKLGLKETDSTEKYFGASITEIDNTIDIDSYKSFIELNKYESETGSICKSKLWTVMLKNQTLVITRKDEKNPFASISLTEKIKQFRQFQEGNKTFSRQEMTLESAKYKLVILNINGDLKKENCIVITNLNAYLFLK